MFSKGHKKMKLHCLEKDFSEHREIVLLPVSPSHSVLPCVFIFSFAEVSNHGSAGLHSLNFN